VLEHSDDALLDHAYLVARGVRPVALIGCCPGDLPTAQAVVTRLKTLGAGTAIPFVIPNGGTFAYGYASHAWAVDLLQWAFSDECPEVQRHRIVGLLLGYSPDEIRAFEEHSSGQAAIWSPSPARTSSLHTSDREGIRAHAAS
jgi:hypothetical protein